MRPHIAIAALAVLAAWPRLGWAGGVDGQRFTPATGVSGGFAVERAAVAAPLDLGVGLFLGAADDPIVQKDAATGATLAHPLRTAVAADLLASIGLPGRTELGIGLPVELVYQGDGLVAGGQRLAPAGGLGDLRLVPKALLWRGDGPSALAIAAAVPVTLPTGDAAALRGADRVTVEPRLLVGWLAPRAAVHVNLGYRLRGASPSGIAGGDEVTAGASATLALVPRRDVLDLHAELTGAVLTGGGAPAATEVPLEALAGVIWKPVRDWAVQAGVGAGLTRGVGDPDARVVLGIRWSPRSSRDRGVDGDRDGDGIADAQDRCPDEAEDEDGFEDGDGCPDPDNDRDGIPDDSDECPNLAEERGGDGDGCPDRAPRATVEHGRLVVTGKIQFQSGSAELKRTSDPLLDEIARALREHGEAGVVRIDGHTDDVGDADFNLNLSEARAESVRRALLQRGVAPERLQTRGYGESRPIAPNHTPAGRALNRRVEFIKVE